MPSQQQQQKKNTEKSSSEKGQVQGPNWKWIKKQQMYKDKLWKASRKPGELLLKTIFKKLQESLAPSKKTIKKWGVAQDACRVL